MSLGYTNTIFGMKVVASPAIREVPVIKTALDCPCTEEFRAKHDAWLLKMFGTKQVAYVIDGDTMVIHPDMLEKLKRQIDEKAMSMLAGI